jgi:Mg-chelatase subunit ChlD
MKYVCPKCNEWFKGKEAQYCPKCGAAIKSGHTEIVMVLDRSGSMQECQEATVAGFNEFIRDQRELPGSANVTLVQFDDQYEVVHDAKPLLDVPELNCQTFVPRGSTALLDAIGKTVNGSAARFRHNKVIFVIITDGMENASKEYKREQIKNLIEQRETNGWTFVYIGADQDAIAVAKDFAIPAVNAVNVRGNPAGTLRAYSCSSERVASFRAS